MHGEAEEKCDWAIDTIKKHKVVVSKHAPGKERDTLEKELLRLEDHHQHCIEAVLNIEKQEQEKYRARSNSNVRH